MSGADVDDLPTTDRDALHDLVALLRAALPGNMVGGYLHGSTGEARLFPRSDLDVLVVTRSPLTPIQRSALTDLVLSASGRYPPLPGGPRPVELTVVTESAISPWRHPATCDLLYGEWMRDDVEAGAVLTPFECPDLAILVAMARGSDSPLFGPPARELFDEVPTRDLVLGTTHGLPSAMEALTSDTTNVVLTLARAWRTCRTGEIVAKDLAADWAAPQLPDGRDVLEHARDVYLGTAVDDWSARAEEVDATARRLAAAVEEAAEDAIERLGGG